jgi:hypothetical protein
MHGDDGPQTGLRIAREQQLLVVVEVGMAKQR